MSKKTHKPQRKKVIGDQVVGVAPGGHKIVQSPYRRFSTEQICRFILTYWHFMMERDLGLSPHPQKGAIFSTRYGSFDQGRRREIKNFLYEYSENQKMHKAETKIDTISEQLQEIYFDLSHEILIPFVFLKVKHLQDVMKNAKKIDANIEKEIEDFFRQFYLDFISLDNKDTFSRWYSTKKELILKEFSKKVAGEQHDTIKLACRIMQIVFETRNFSATKIQETINAVDTKLNKLVENIPDEKLKRETREKIWLDKMLEFSLFDPSTPNFERSAIQLIEYLLGFFNIHAELRKTIIHLIDFSIIEKPPIGKRFYEVPFKVSRPLRNKRNLE